MPNTHPSPIILERSVASLDAKVLDILTPLGFSDSPERWSDELVRIFAERYRSRAADVKDAIHAVAQEFRATGKTDQLVQMGQDLVQRKDILRSMLAGLDVLTSREFRPSGNHLERLDRLQDYVPIFRATVSAISARTSLWRDTLGEWELVFRTLERPVSTITLLLHFVPATVSDAHIAKGQDVINTLTGLWDGRRRILKDLDRLVSNEEPEDPARLVERLDEQHEDQEIPVSRLLDVLKELDSLPPLYLPTGYFTASQFLEAEATFNRLHSERDSISQDIDRLERIFDHFMRIVDSGAARVEE